MPGRDAIRVRLSIVWCTRPGGKASVMLNTKAMDTAVVCGRGGPARKYNNSTKRFNGYNGPSEECPCAK